MLFSKTDTGAPPLAAIFTPENCVDSSRIRAFLRLSRIATDDTIRQHLNEIKKTQCDEFFRTQIAPQWKSRADAIQYCSDYAEGLRSQAEALPSDAVYDYRTDPYAAKNVADQIEEHNLTCVSIQNWVSNELQVESIIKEQTASVLNDKCYYADWLKAFRDLA